MWSNDLLNYYILIGYKQLGPVEVGYQEATYNDAHDNKEVTAEPNRVTSPTSGLVVFTEISYRVRIGH